MDEQTQPANEELDLGLETLTPSLSQIDYEAAIAKAKPDFQRIAKLLGIQPTGSTQEEVVADLLYKQKAFEEDLKANTVPKIKSALEALTTKAAGNSSTKPGVSVNSQPQQENRKVKSWKGY